MNKARLLSIATIVAILSATGVTYAADAKPATEAAATATAAPEAKKDAPMKSHKKRHGKKHHAKK